MDDTGKQLDLSYMNLKEDSPDKKKGKILLPKLKTEER